MRYRKREIFEAEPWSGEENATVKFLSHDGQPRSKAKCHLCKQPFSAHGWIIWDTTREDTDKPPPLNFHFSAYGRGFPVCPGDMIITDERHRSWPLSQEEFTREYEEM